MFQIDWTALIRQFIPAFLYGEIFKNWITVLITPLMTVYNQFLAFRNDSIYRVSHTGQVISITDMLNDRFDPLSHRIYLSDYTHDIVYVGKSTETVSTYVPKESEWTTAPSNAKNYMGTIQDYYCTTLINIYDDIEPQPNQVAVLNLVEPYRLAGKIFKVENYSANPQ